MLEQIRTAIDIYIEEVQGFRSLMKSTTGKTNYYMGFTDLEMKILNKASNGKDELKKSRRVLLHHEDLCREKTLIASDLLRKYYELSEDEMNISSKYVDVWKGFTFLNSDGDIKNTEELVQSIWRLVDKWNAELNKDLKLSNSKIMETVIVPLNMENKDTEKIEIVEKSYKYQEKEDGQLSLL